MRSPQQCLCMCLAWNVLFSWRGTPASCATLLRHQLISDLLTFIDIFICPSGPLLPLYTLLHAWEADQYGLHQGAPVLSSIWVWLEGHTGRSWKRKCWDIYHCSQSIPARPHDPTSRFPFHFVPAGLVFVTTLLSGAMAPGHCSTHCTGQHLCK